MVLLTIETEEGKKDKKKYIRENGILFLCDVNVCYRNSWHRQCKPAAIQKVSRNQRMREGEKEVQSLRKL